MAENSSISWTDHTFNPWIGCTKVGPGCDHCYAERMMDTQYGKVKWGSGEPRSRTTPKYWKKAATWNDQPWAECMECGWRGDVRQAPWSDTPAGAHPITSEQWRLCPTCTGIALKEARARVFCASLADVFDNEIDPAWRADLWKRIASTPNLDWLLLTKRIGNALPMLPVLRLDNVWLGATIVTREEMLRDGPKLASLTGVRFWSVEPLLEDLGVIPPELMPDWVIVGGESGPGAREFRIPWARSIVDQCKAAGVAVHVKQLGAEPRQWCAALLQSGDPEHDDVTYCDLEAAHEGSCAGRCQFIRHPKGGDLNEWPPELRIQEFPK